MQEDILKDILEGNKTMRNLHINLSKIYEVYYKIYTTLLIPMNTKQVTLLTYKYNVFMEGIDFILGINNKNTKDIA